MTKQQEIREEMQRIVASALQAQQNWWELYISTTKLILTHLHSQHVAIVVGYWTEPLIEE